MKLRNKKTGDIIELATKRLNLNCGIENYGFDTLAELNEEWEDCEDKDYYFIDSYATGDSRIIDDVDNGWSGDLARKEIGNYFKTRKEAEKAVEKLKAWKRLKDKGFKFTDYDYTTYNGKGCGQVFFNEVSDNINEIKDDLNLLFGGND